VRFARLNWARQGEFLRRFYAAAAPSADYLWRPYAGGRRFGVMAAVILILAWLAYVAVLWLVLLRRERFLRRLYARVLRFAARQSPQGANSG